MNNQNFDNVTVSRLTAIWAFSESAFGGILHAISIPFRGIFINAASVILITLIAIKSFSKQILKSTVIVVLIKALVSPHSPLTAHFAVSTQGIIGSILFRTKKFFRISALLLGVITLFLSGTQKIIILTLLFGNSLWKSIDIFIKQVSKEFLKLGLPADIHYGYLLVGIYVLVHVIAGLIVGFYAGLLPKKLETASKHFQNFEIENDITTFPKRERKGKKRSWIQRPSGIIILSILFIIMIYSYFYPYEFGLKSLEILIMIIRAILLTIIWYFVLAPFVRKLFSKYLSKKKNIYSEEVNEIVNLFPRFNKVVAYCWNDSKNEKGIKRIKNFIANSFYGLLFTK